MEALRIVVGVVLPYVAIAVFAGAMIWRVRTWVRLSQPAMTLFPAPPTAQANTVNTVQEALFFKSLFKADRALWTFAWVFHAVLALVFIGHLRVVANVDGLFTGMGMSETSIHSMSAGIGGAAGVVLCVTGLLLLGRRLFLQRAREISGPGDYAALALIGAILVTGNMMRFGPGHFDLGLTRDYFAGLATFSGVAGAEALRHNVFLFHMGLAFLLVMVIPFSKILHFGGIFFTQQLLRKN